MGSLLVSQEGKLKFFGLLAAEFGVDSNEVDTAIAALSAAKVSLWLVVLADGTDECAHTYIR